MLALHGLQQSLFEKSLVFCGSFPCFQVVQTEVESLTGTRVRISLVVRLLTRYDRRYELWKKSVTPMSLQRNMKEHQRIGFGELAGGRDNLALASP